MDDFVFALGDYVWYRSAPITAIQKIYKIVRIPTFADTYDLEDKKGGVRTIDAMWLHPTDKATRVEVLLYF